MRHSATAFQASGRWCRGEATVDEVGGAPLVLVREEPRVHALDVAERRLSDLALQVLEHDRRDVDGDHTRASPRHGQGELAGAGSEVYDRRVVAQHSSCREEPHLLARPGVLLLVVARHVDRIEVLPTRMRQLIEKPCLVRHWAIVPWQRRTQSDWVSRWSTSPAGRSCSLQRGLCPEGGGSSPQCPCSTPALMTGNLSLMDFHRIGQPFGQEEVGGVRRRAGSPSRADSGPHGCPRLSGCARGGPGGRRLSDHPLSPQWPPSPGPLTSSGPPPQAVRTRALRGSETQPHCVANCTYRTSVYGSRLSNIFPIAGLPERRRDKGAGVR